MLTWAIGIYIYKNDKDKTALTSHHGLFSFTRMSFGLKNASGTFQRVIEVILSTVKWNFALHYVDYVIVFSSSLE